MTVFDHNIAPIHAVINGQFRARLAAGPSDVDAAQQLRTKMFRGRHALNAKRDSDRFDAICQHVLVEDAHTGALQACFRFLHLHTGADIDLIDAAQFYDLVNLGKYKLPILEIGRFCTAQNVTDPSVLRLGWAVLTRFVDAHGIGLMMGCTSFAGNDTAPYRDALALLKERHLAPNIWKPLVKAPEVVRFAASLSDHKPTLKLANQFMPSLLRTYLTMGGWVSDHAVIDRDLATFHVFTGVEIANIPPRRAALLRADAL
jgi:putative hemolysin